jgi:uracil-DNA glycosylase family 4
MEMSKWLKHVARWKNCTECDLCRHRSRVVLARGVIPCHVMFIGEAPGLSEDALGKPFIGPAGKLLDSIIHEALSGLVLNDGQPLTWAFTNLVACLPLDDYGRKTNAPSKQSIKACEPRLMEFVEIAAPGLIICVGKLASTHVKLAFGEEFYLADVIHPAAILRMVYAARGLAIQEAVVTIQDAVEDIWEVNVAKGYNKSSEED